jgi:hypothetical protein
VGVAVVDWSDGQIRPLNWQRRRRLISPSPTDNLKQLSEKSESDFFPNFICRQPRGQVCC